MARQSSTLASVVRKDLQEKGWSPRDVARASGDRISHMTVNEMMRGVVPSPRKLTVFALTIGEHPDRYFAAAEEPYRYTGDLDLSRVEHALAMA